MEVMKIKDILDVQRYAKLLREYDYDINYQPIDKTPQKGSKEHLSASDLDELMGVNKQTYKRVNGRVRSK